MNSDILITSSVESLVAGCELLKLLLCCHYELMTTKEVSFEW